jgi:hypothetical protein
VLGQSPHAALPKTTKATNRSDARQQLRNKSLRQTGLSCENIPASTDNAAAATHCTRPPKALHPAPHLCQPSNVAVQQCHTLLVSRHSLQVSKHLHHSGPFMRLTCPAGSNEVLDRLGKVIWERQPCTFSNTLCKTQQQLLLWQCPLLPMLAINVAVYRQ